MTNEQETPSGDDGKGPPRCRVIDSEVDLQTPDCAEQCPDFGDAAFANQGRR